MAWATGGLLTNPAQNAILADTGPLAATPFVPTILCWSDVACLVTLRHRNAANSADLHTQQMALTTENTPFCIFGLPTSITLGANERLILTVDTALTGRIQCSILTS